jgi:hypothetical protein
LEIIIATSRILSKFIELLSLVETKLTASLGTSASRPQILGSAHNKVIALVLGHLGVLMFRGSKARALSGGSATGAVAIQIYVVIMGLAVVELFIIQLSLIDLVLIVGLIIKLALLRAREALVSLTNRC